MEKQLFGEYLVKKGLITEEHLAETLIKQIRSLPSIAEIIYEKKLVNPKQLIAILKYQTVKGVSMIDAAKALGIWTANVDREFQTYLSQSKIPIAALLIEQGLVNLDQITSAFDEFLSTQELTPEPTKEKVSASVAQLTDVITTDRKTVLTKFADSILTGPFSSSDVQKIRDEVQAIHSSTLQNSITPFETLTAALLAVVDGWLQKGAASLNSDLASRMKVVVEGYVSLLWGLKDQFASGKNENDFLSDTAHKKQFDTILGTAQVLSFDIDTNLVDTKA